MGFLGNWWPYTNEDKINLDWVLRTIKTLETNLANFVSLNSIKYANPFQWDITRQYEQNTLVIDGADGTAYLSVQPVPVGVQITNTDYWTPVFTLQNFTDALKKAITLFPQQENGQAATEAIPANSVFFVGDVLCTNTAEIPNTSLVIVGSNCQQVDVVGLISTAVAQLTDKISEEAAARENADNNLSARIDTLVTQSGFESLRGKTIAIFGSSNENLAGASFKQWPELLAEKLSGIATVVNKSIGGYTVVDSIKQYLADTEKNNYDIVLFTSVRNAYRNRYLPIEESSFDSWVLVPPTDPYLSVTSSIRYLSKNRPIKSEIYFASCLPAIENFYGAYSMPVYDYAVYRCCGLFGFKYLDMHSWLGISDSDSASYTTDGWHYNAESNIILADRCAQALIAGGESLKTYSCYADDFWNASDQFDIMRLAIDSTGMMEIELIFSVGKTITATGNSIIATPSSNYENATSLAPFHNCHKSLYFFPTLCHTFTVANSGTLRFLESFTITNNFGRNASLMLQAPINFRNFMYIN